jgi:ElaB/YqjD/DUF883 family membrane-anchored ribosome-binding protein
MNALILALFASLAAAQRDEQLNGIVSDLGAHRSEYLGQIASGNVPPADLLSLAQEVQTYTDDSFTTLYSEVDLGAVSSYVTGLPWYSSRLESLFQAQVTSGSVEASVSSDLASVTSALSSLISEATSEAPSVLSSLSSRASSALSSLSSRASEASSEASSVSSHVSSASSHASSATASGTASSTSSNGAGSMAMMGPLVIVAMLIPALF